MSSASVKGEQWHGCRRTARAVGSSAHRHIHKRRLICEQLEERRLLSIATYVVPAVTDETILPDSTISAEYASDTILMRACPGEYEPASFVLRADQDITNLAISVSNLTNGGNTILAGDVDIRVVKCWYQAGYNINDVNHKHLTPELLLKDASLVKVENGENYLKVSGNYVIVSDPDGIPGIAEEPYATAFPVQDSSTLQPVAISSGTNLQFWITVHVPDAALAGLYEGTITVTSPQATEQLTLDLSVLPFELSEPSLTSSLYYRSILGTQGKIASDVKSSVQMDAELRDLMSHGVTNPTNYQTSNAALQQALARRVAAGMVNERLYDPATSIRVCYVQYYDAEGNKRDPTPEELAAECDRLHLAVEQRIAAAAPYGVTEVYFYGRDETSMNNHDDRARIDAVHAAGGKVFCAQGADDAAAIADVLDLAIISQVVSVDLANQYHGYGHEIFSYSNPQVGEERPETYRRNFGLLLWQAGYDGSMDYAYQHNFGNIWNDFDATNYRDHCFTYPTVNGVIDTIQYEGFREAVDDLRYLTTLLDAIDEAKAEGKDCSEAEAWLNDLKSSDLADLESIRLTMISYILDPASGTAANWKMDEGSGSTLYDATSNHNDGAYRRRCAGAWTNRQWPAL